MTTRRHFQAVEQPQQPQEHTESGTTIDPGLCRFATPGGRCRLRAGHGGDHDPVGDTTQQVAAISEPAEALSAELQKRIQKVKLQHHALQRRMSPPAGIPAAVKKP